MQHEYSRRMQHEFNSKMQLNSENYYYALDDDQSTSGQSMTYTYGRQQRGHLPPLPPANEVANMLTFSHHHQQQHQQHQQHQHLAGLHQASAGHHQHTQHLSPAPTLAWPSANAPPPPLAWATQTLHSAHSAHSARSVQAPQAPKKFLHPPVTAAPLGGLRWRWRRRLAGFERRTLLEWSVLLILVAVILALILIKFTTIKLAQGNPKSLVLTTAQDEFKLSQDNANFINYPPKISELPPQQPAPDGQFDHSNTFPSGPLASGQAAPDVLRSKLLIGEFVVLSQNYTNSVAQKSLLADSLVKLLDQVFLSTDVRRVYSRTEITNIRPHRPGGIVVDCQIILSDSITYAAQQFGIALYDSLFKSAERLANQANFIIDKNSIRFNTVPDKDLGIVPPELIPSTVTRAELVNNAQAPPRPPIDQMEATPMQVGQDALRGQEQQANAVVWSEWSSWSSCVDKNGVCDAGRLHSRLRRCVAQHTGEKVDAQQCRLRFSMQDQELEVTDCSASCNSAEQQHVQSDAPSVISPHTAPSVMIVGGTLGSSMVGAELPAPMLLPSPLGSSRLRPSKAPTLDSLALPSSSNGLPTNRAEPGELYASPSPNSANSIAGLVASQSPPSSSTTEHAGQASEQPPAGVLLDTQQPQQQMSCSNCTSDEICLLLVQQKVPFCAKIKDRQDVSGCGGWCKAQGQLCQPVGANAFKCVHDSECLRDEWRCHDSACIPLSKRCDGHSNCYDNSDERDCPNR